MVTHIYSFKKRRRPKGDLQIKKTAETLGYHITPARMAKIKKKPLMTVYAEEDVE